MKKTGIGSEEFNKLSKDKRSYASALTTLSNTASAQGRFSGLNNPLDVQSAVLNVEGVFNPNDKADIKEAPGQIQGMAIKSQQAQGKSENMSLDLYSKFAEEYKRSQVDIIEETKKFVESIKKINTALTATSNSEALMGYFPNIYNIRNNSMQGNVPLSTNTQPAKKP
jgi:hypothetical protein